MAPPDSDERSQRSHRTREIGATQSPHPTTCRVSAAIVNHDQTPEVCAQLQAYQADDPALFRQVRWLVVCNGSAESTVALRIRLAELGYRSEVDVVPCRNAGYGAAINLAMRETSTPFLLALNADLSPERGFLLGLGRVLDELSSGEVDRGDPVGLVGFRLCNPDGSPQGSVGRFPSLARVLSGLLRPRSVRKYLPVSDRAEDVPWVTGACFVASRDCWQALGGFDERFFMYYEDVDLCARAWTSGWRVRFDPSISSRHLHPYHSRPISHEMAHWARRAMLLYFWKHRPAWEFQTLSRIVLLECAFRKRRSSSEGKQGWREIEATVRRLLADPAHAACDIRSLPRAD